MGERIGDDGTALVELECMRASGQLFKNKKQVVAHSGHPHIYRLASQPGPQQTGERTWPLGHPFPREKGVTRFGGRARFCYSGNQARRQRSQVRACSFTCRSPPPTASNPGGKGAGPAREVFHFVFTARGQLFLSPDTSLSSPPPPAHDSPWVTAPLLRGIPDFPGALCIRRTASIVNLPGPHCRGWRKLTRGPKAERVCGARDRVAGRSSNLACPCPPFP